MSSQPAKNSVCNLIYLVKGKQVCLSLKKRGFGAGWYNGYGGKVEPGEGLEASARRELWEESGVAARVLERRAVLFFKFLDTGEEITTHVFLCEAYAGEPAESEEMAPYWFAVDELPFEHMWPDDRLWLARFLNGERLEASFDFQTPGPKILNYNIRALDKL